MRNHSRPRASVDLRMLLLILLLGAGLLWAMQRSGQLHAWTRGLFHLIAPVQGRMNVEALRLPAVFERAAANRLAQEQLLELQADNRRLQSENAVLQEALRENASLRAQLAYADLSPRFSFTGAHVVGKVLGHDPHSFLDYILIDAGRQHGVASGMPVVTPAGLVGRVSEAGVSVSRVLLILDASSSVSGLLQNSRVNGQVVGTGAGGLRMQFLTSADPVAVGEQVVTSHLSATLPQGIPIGVVQALEEQRNSTVIYASMLSAVDFAGLEHVMVITDYDVALDEPGSADIPSNGG